MENCVYPGKYLHFHIKELINSKGKKVTWEIASRHSDKSLQGVDLIPNIGDDYVINLEKRYPVNCYVLSFPGGICENSDVIEQGLKELKEETGYTGTRESVTDISPLIYIDPWKSSEKNQFISITLHETHNDETHQELEELEDIKPILVSKNSFLQDIQKVSQEQDAKIDSRLFAYGLGLLYGNTNKNE